MLNASAARRARVSAADRTVLAQLGGDDRVVGRIRGRGDAGRIARGGPEQRRPADVDHLDRLVDADELGADGGRERLDVDDHEVDESDALLAQLLELGRDVAPGKDPGVDRVVEGLDLAADMRAALGQLRDGADGHAVGREGLARPVGRKDLDLQLEEVARKRRDALPVRH